MTIDHLTDGLRGLDARIEEVTRPFSADIELLESIPGVEQCSADATLAESRKRVARLMRELGVKSVTRRRFKTGTTKRDARAKAAPDLARRDFSAEGPDQLWVADIDYDAGICRYHLMLRSVTVEFPPFGSRPELMGRREGNSKRRFAGPAFLRDHRHGYRANHDSRKAPSRRGGPRRPGAISKNKGEGFGEIVAGLGHGLALARGSTRPTEETKPGRHERPASRPADRGLRFTQRRSPRPLKPSRNPP